MAARAAAGIGTPSTIEPSGGDQHSGGCHLPEPSRFQSTDRLCESHQLGRCSGVHAGLVGDDFFLHTHGWKIELNGDHALPGRVLEVLQNALVSGVVGNHEAELRWRIDHKAKPVDRELTAVICQRVEDDGRVLSSLDNLVEVADRPVAHGPSERAVYPVGLAALQEEPTHEIAPW